MISRAGLLLCFNEKTYGFHISLTIQFELLQIHVVFDKVLWQIVKT